MGIVWALLITLATVVLLALSSIRALGLLFYCITLGLISLLPHKLAPALVYVFFCALAVFDPL